jgi:ferredoxin-NADP reductase
MTPTDAPSRTPAAIWQNARIIDIVRRTPRIKSYFLALPEPFEFRAGQHVDVRLTAPDGYRAMRSYSIASAPSRSATIELAIDLLDNGEVSPFFHEVAAVGDEIELRGPLGGYFIWSPSYGGPLLLVGGGSGLVPLMSMIRARQAAAVKVPALLLLSARNWEDALYRDELIGYERLDDGFAVVFALTRKKAMRQGDYSRRVDTAMMSEVLGRLPEDPRHVFVCGSNAFVNSAADGAVAAGVPAGRIRTERYGG